MPKPKTGCSRSQGAQHDLPGYHPLWKRPGRRLNLETLIRRLAAIDDLRWIRLLYAYPDGITDSLIELISDEEKVCKYLDIPIQHISDPVLKRMNAAAVNSKSGT